MAKEVIHIYGASGSGTSTLGRYLGDKLGYFFMDTDDYFWLPTDPPYTKKRDKALRLEMMKHDLAQTDKAVIRSSAKHDDWEKLLQCKKVVLDGSQPLDENLEIIRNCLR